MAGEAYRAFHARSLKDRDAFWTEQAKLIEWRKPCTKVLDYSRPPFAQWFVGGETNLCHKRFQTTDRTLTLVGVAFDVEAKNVREWKQEEGRGRHRLFPEYFVVGRLEGVVATV